MAWHQITRAVVFSLVVFSSSGALDMVALLLGGESGEGSEGGEYD